MHRKPEKTFLMDIYSNFTKFVRGTVTICMEADIKVHKLSMRRVYCLILRFRFLIVQELAVKKRHQAYRIAAVVQNARLKPKS